MDMSVASPFQVQLMDVSLCMNRAGVGLRTQELEIYLHPLTEPSVKSDGSGELQAGHR